MCLVVLVCFVLFVCAFVICLCLSFVCSFVRFGRLLFVCLFVVSWMVGLCVCLLFVCSFDRLVVCLCGLAMFCSCVCLFCCVLVVHLFGG